MSDSARVRAREIVEGCHHGFLYAQAGACVDCIAAALDDAARERDQANERADKEREFAAAQAANYEMAKEEAAALRERVAGLEGALREIAKGEGAFSRDPLTHASNTIDSMKAIATAALGEQNLNISSSESA